LIQLAHGGPSISNTGPYIKKEGPYENISLSAGVLDMGGQQITTGKIKTSYSDAHARRENNIFTLNFKKLPKIRTILFVFVVFFEYKTNLLGFTQAT